MVSASKKMKTASQRHNSNINKRGNVPDSIAGKKGSVTVGPVMLGFFLFVVVGSALLQIIKTASSGESL